MRGAVFTVSAGPSATHGRLAARLRRRSSPATRAIVTNPTLSATREAHRILMPMINEAVFCLHEGVADAASIDGIMKLGMNHPMGPLALADLIGLDTCPYILEVLHDGLGEDKYRPCPLLRKHVEAGWLGRKAGRGFYDYSQGA